MNIPTTTTSSNRIAVFIDFDNVEIGVKNTIGGQFDIGLILEAIKERGEIVTKVAYSDWKRAGDYSRVLTQHAIRMVQRNMTPGGDKNGADITMALDALEMAFTHDHINAFVIVGGDSDFISLVEKLKQYGRKVIVVGGRQFTSLTMQKNCHEFIAYENLVGARSGRSGGRGEKPTVASADIAKVLPLVKRALKVLTEREVAPQLGLLKSTLLQLDSTFSEREYGANSFRDFMEKVAQTGAVTLKNAGRSMMVESRENGEVEIAAPQGEASAAEIRDDDRRRQDDGGRRHDDGGQPHDDGGRVLSEPADDEESLPQSPMTMQDGMRAVQQAFAQASPPPRWPMYVRQAKQFLKARIEGFDERKYGFASVVDVLRAAAKDGVLKLERDRHGAFRVFAGPKLTAVPQPRIEVEEPPIDVAGEVIAEQPPVEEGESIEEAPIVDAEPIETPEPVAVATAEAEAVVADGSAEVAEPPTKGGRKRKAAPRTRAGRSDPRKSDKTARPRARKSTRTKSEAADR
ncbi:MAG TPA: NYN domain-containing protein [Vicinamibacterales bacterium]|nr:NYN domain-containing protein [Vicinamibacterales bacterium]